MKKITKIFTTAMAAATMVVTMAMTTGVSASARIVETSDDSRFLHDVGLCDDSWGQMMTLLNWGNVSETVDNAWAKGGVTCVTKYDTYNEYYIDGEKVTFTTAAEHVIKVLDVYYDVRNALSYRTYA